MSEKPLIPAKNITGSFTNSAGETYPVQGRSPLLYEKLGRAIEADFIAKGKPILPHPTYEITTVTGDIETHEHDATTLVKEGDPEQTEKNKAQWQEYVLQQNEMQAEYSTRSMKMVLLAVQAKPTPEWREEMAVLGIPTPPPNSVEERYSFIETHVIQSPEDLSKLMALVFRLSGLISEEAVAEAESTFQGIVERAFTQAGKQVPETKRVDSDPVLQRGGDSEILEHETVGPGLV
jgi:hypothetical protein